MLFWDPNLFKINIPLIDEQHNKLFTNLDKFRDCDVSTRPECLVEMLIFLDDYAHYHFQSEEELMEQSSYPGLSEHRAEHQSFIRKIQQFRETALKEGNTVKQQISLFNSMYEWMLHHISGTDKKMGAYLTKQK